MIDPSDWGRLLVVVFVLVSIFGIFCSRRTNVESAMKRKIFSIRTYISQTGWAWVQLLGVLLAAALTVITIFLAISLFKALSFSSAQAISKSDCTSKSGVALQSNSGSVADASKEMRSPYNESMGDMNDKFLVYSMNKKESMGKAANSINFICQAQPVSNADERSYERNSGQNGLAEKGKEDPSSKDAISNAMTAVGIAISAIVLIISLGTSWFGKKIEELDIQRIVSKQEMDRILKEFDEFARENSEKIDNINKTAENKVDELNGKVDYLNSRANVVQLYFLAILELTDYIKLRTASEQFASAAIKKIAETIFSFMDVDESIRFKAFDQIYDVTETMDRNEVVKCFPHLGAFLNACNEKLHGGQPNLPGKFCLVFLESERHLFLSKKYENHKSIY